MSNTLTWLWRGFILTRQVVIISRFCIVYSTSLACLPRRHFTSLLRQTHCLVTRLQLNYVAHWLSQQSILIRTNQKVRWWFRSSLRVTFKLTIVNAGRLAWWIVRFYSFSQRCLSFVTNSEFIVVDKGMCVFMIFLQLIYNPLVLSLSSYSFAEYPPFIIVYEPRLYRLLTCIQPIGLISLAKTCLWCLLLHLVYWQSDQGKVLKI